MIAKTIDMFDGAEVIHFISAKKKKPGLFDDYEGFVDKFKRKKTTDDCMTPPKYYECVLKYVSDNFDLTNRKIVRPFFPDGDYEAVDYPEGCVVIDNPPFSIISKIARFYTERGVLFFLFAPHLTLFSADLDCTKVVCHAPLTYDNGAKIMTSFLSNLFGDLRIITAPELRKSLMAKREPKRSLPKYEYPPNVLTVTMLDKLVDNGMTIKIEKSQTFHIKRLDCQKRHGKTIFGGGYLLSEKAAAEKAAEKTLGEDGAIVWHLSDREKDIIKSLK
jgi:hypothetical protein